MDKTKDLIQSKRLTVVFQVRNEARQIKAAIKSAQLLTDNVVVMDMKSQDATAAYAKQAGARVITIPSASYVEPVRSLAFTKTESEWVLLLDADERLTQELVDEIKTKIQIDSDTTHYTIPRRNLFAGKVWLKHGGWWPDSQTRLIRRSSFKNWPKAIHSTVQVEGKKEVLESPFLHLFHGDLTEMVKKTINFEDQEAELLYQAGRRVKTSTFFRKFLAEFYRRALLKRGLRDGIYGLIESLYQAYSKTITWLLLYEKQRS